MHAWHRLSEPFSKGLDYQRQSLAHALMTEDSAFQSRLKNLSRGEVGHRRQAKTRDPCTTGSVVGANKGWPGYVQACQLVSAQQKKTAPEATKADKTIVAWRTVLDGNKDAIAERRGWALWVGTASYFLSGSGGHHASCPWFLASVSINLTGDGSAKVSSLVTVSSPAPWQGRPNHVA